MRNLITVLIGILTIYNLGNSETYYSRAAGAWNDLQTWSTTGYDGAPAASFPSTTADIVYIGNGKTVTLDQDRPVGTLTVDGGSKLIFGAFVVSGNTFRLQGGATLDIGNPDGISASAAAGSVQTTQRDFNADAANSNCFIYSGAAAKTGDGLPSAIASLEIKVNSGVTLVLSNLLSVRQDVTISSGTFNIQNMTLSVGGNFINNSNFSGISSTLIFNGSAAQSIMGTSATTLNELQILKSTGTFTLQNDITCNGDIRLLSNSILDMNGNDITIARNSNFYSDYETSQNFKNEKFVRQSGTSAVIYNLGSSGSLPDTLLYPVGTGNYYSPCRIILNNGVTVGSATVSVRVVGVQCPTVLKSNVSLKRYWEIATTGTLDLGNYGVDLEFGYASADVQGSPANYHVFNYYGSKWDLDPGISANTVVPASYRFLSKRITGNLDGYWTAGELKTGRYCYYSRTSGNYDNFNTWSADSHTGAISSKAPDNDQDIVMIGANHTVNLTKLPSAAAEIIVEESGRLMLNSYYIPSTVVSFSLKAGGTLGFSADQGISMDDGSGALRAQSESLDEAAIYMFTGSGSQETGLGMPDRVAALVINKDDNIAKVSASKSISVRDSLVINNGVLDLTSQYYDISGESTSTSQLTMRGGKLLLWSTFPEGYKPVTLKYGMVEYTETGASSLIKGQSVGVNQYNDLALTGNRGGKTINFNPNDTIKIYGTLSLDKLEFNSSTGERFVTNGSTICFNGDSNQVIPCRCKTDSSWMRLNYYNLKIEGKGTKKLSDTNHVVLNDVILIEGALNLNKRDLRVSGNWINYNAKLIDTLFETVTFANDIENTEKSILSSGMEFYKVNIEGRGKYSIADTMRVRRVFYIDSGATFRGSSNTVVIGGDWIDDGTFDPQTSTVSFEGKDLQNINKKTPEQFYNLAVNKQDKSINIANIANNYIHVLNLLMFRNGVINASGNNRYVLVDSNIVQNGEGHVFGTLKIKVRPGNTPPIQFSVGNLYKYRPATLQFTGTGGAEGYIEVYNEDVNQNFFNSNGGSGILWDKAIQQKWDITIPQGSTFGLGNRNFSLQLGWTESDLTSLADPLKFAIKRLTGGVWYKTSTNEKNNYYTKSVAIDGFGSFITGQPENDETTTYYSRQDGFWSTPSTWSTTGWDGVAATGYPTEFDNVMIGNGRTVTLDKDVTVNTGVSVTLANGTSPGTLDCRTFAVSGEGSFIMQDNTTLVVSSPNGISAGDNTGNIRTKTRNFNESGVEKSNFIYTCTELQHSGNGIPDGLKQLTIRTSDVVMDKSFTVHDKLLVESGSVYNPAGGSTITLLGNFVSKPGAGFNLGKDGIIFSGAKEQLFDIAGSKIINKTLTIDKTGGQVIVETSNLKIDSVLILKSGIINTRFNNKYVSLPKGSIVQTDGEDAWVDGKIIRYFKSGTGSPFTYPLGTDSGYAPVKIELDATSDYEGFIGAVAIKGLHPQLGNSTLNQAKTINKFWRLSADSNIVNNGILYAMTLYYSAGELPSGTDYTKLTVKSYFDNQWHNVNVTSSILGAISVDSIVKPDADYIVGEETIQGIDDIHDIDELTAYPLPAKDKVYIRFKLEKLCTVELRLYDFAGNELEKIMCEEMYAGVNILPLDISGYRSGTYFYRLTINGKVKSGSIIKVK